MWFSVLFSLLVILCVGEALHNCHIRPFSESFIKKHPHLEVRIKNITRGDETKSIYYVVLVENFNKTTDLKAAWPYFDQRWDPERGLILDPNSEILNLTAGERREKLIVEHLTKISNTRHLFLSVKDANSLNTFYYLRREPFSFGLQIALLNETRFGYVSDIDLSTVYITPTYFLNYSAKNIGPQCAKKNGIFLDGTHFWNKTSNTIEIMTKGNCPVVWSADTEFQEKYIDLGSIDNNFEVRWYESGAVRMFNTTDCFMYNLEEQKEDGSRVIYRQPVDLKEP